MCGVTKELRSINTLLLVYDLFTWYDCDCDLFIAYNVLCKISAIALETMQSNSSDQLFEQTVKRFLYLFIKTTILQETMKLNSIFDKPFMCQKIVQ